MRFMIIRKADAETEANALPTAELIEAMSAYNNELAEAGVLRGGEGLRASELGARVEFSGGKPKVIDGPFAEAKELVAGFTMIEVASRAEAIEWVKRWPALDGHGEARLELRQIFEAEDFGAEFAPAMRAEVELLREHTKAESGPAIRG